MQAPDDLICPEHTVYSAEMMHWFTKGLGHFQGIAWGCLPKEQMVNRDGEDGYFLKDEWTLPSARPFWGLFVKLRTLAQNKWRVRENFEAWGEDHRGILVGGLEDALKLREGEEAAGILQTWKQQRDFVELQVGMEGSRQEADRAAEG